MDPDAQTLDRLVAALRQPEAYPEPVTRVEVLETHISYLFLTGQHVYKLKKPVDFGFLDFTTLESRKYYCELEVAVNRRMSPEAYLGVVQIREAEGRYTIDGPGQVVDYAVKMRQLPRERAMSVLLQRNQVSEQDVRRLAVRIADFHRRAETGPEIVAEGGIEALRENVAENFRQTEKYVGVTLSSRAFADLKAYSLAYLDVRQELLVARAGSGHVRDCHGDLHTAQIFLEEAGISILDSIEFNHRFRYCDVALDLAFLAMDLDHYGHPELSECLVQEYVAASADPGVLELLGFAKLYRAYVRGKVTSFRLDHPETLTEEERVQVPEVARSYFDLACSYLPRLPVPSLFIFAGLMGSGKSALSQSLAQHWELERLSSDLVRKELAGVAPRERQFEAYGSGIYSPEFTRRTYQEMLRRAARSLGSGQSVILDASFHSAATRREAVEAARAAGAEAWVVECVASEATLRSRLERRVNEGESVSDGRWELLQRQREDWVPISEVPPQRHLRRNTEGTRAETLASLLREIYARLID